MWIQGAILNISLEMSPLSILSSTIGPFWPKSPGFTRPGLTTQSINPNNLENGENIFELIN